MNHNYGKYMLFMFIGCFVPIIVLAVLERTGLVAEVLFRSLSLFGTLLCLSIHIFMMKDIVSGKGEKFHTYKTNAIVKTKKLKGVIYYDDFNSGYSCFRNLLFYEG